MVRRAGRPIPPNYAEELVHDAMASIWLGTRSWDPQRTPLCPHLCLIIKDRTWREIKRTQRHRHVSFDLAVNDSLSDDGAELDDARAQAEKAASALEATRHAMEEHASRRAPVAKQRRLEAEHALDEALLRLSDVCGGR